MDWECFLHSKSLNQEALVLLLTQTIGLERLLEGVLVSRPRLLVQQHACTGWICAQSEQTLKNTKEG